MEASYPVAYRELACSKVVHLTVRLNKERCGQLLRYCPLCPAAEEGEEELQQHLRTHLKIVLGQFFFSPARVCDQVVFHTRFPSLLGTTCTDQKLSEKLEYWGRKSMTTHKGIIFHVIAVEVREMGIRLLYCSVCGHQSTDDVSLQEAHFFDTHVALEERSTREFNHFMPL